MYMYINIYVEPNFNRTWQAQTGPGMIVPRGLIEEDIGRVSQTEDSKLGVLVLVTY